MPSSATASVLSSSSFSPSSAPAAVGGPAASPDALRQVGSRLSAVSLQVERLTERTRHDRTCPVSLAREDERWRARCDCTVRWITREIDVVLNEARALLDSLTP